MDDAIGGFDILDESPAAAAAVLVDVKSGCFPPRFEVDDSRPFGNPFDPNRCPGPPPPVFDQCTGPPPVLLVIQLTRTRFLPPPSLPRK